MDKYKEVTNDSDYDASCTLTPLPVSDLNYRMIILNGNPMNNMYEGRAGGLK
jgi:hypothetical protein